MKVTQQRGSKTVPVMFFKKTKPFSSHPSDIPCHSTWNNGPLNHIATEKRQKAIKCLLPCHTTSFASHQGLVLAVVLSLLFNLTFSLFFLSDDFRLVTNLPYVFRVFSTAPAYVGEAVLNGRDLHFVVFPNKTSHQLVKDQAAWINASSGNDPH